MDPLLVPLYEILNLNTALFENCLADLDDEAALRRPNAATNNFAFVAAHVVEARYFLASQIGVSEGKAFGGALDGVKSIEEIDRLPTLEDIEEHWDAISEQIGERFQTLNASELLASREPMFPVDDTTLLGGIAFLLQHESYHIGQMGLLRKFVGAEAMSYEV